MYVALELHSKVRLGLIIIGIYSSSKRINLTCDKSGPALWGVPFTNMTGTNKHWHSRSKRKICGRLPSFDQIQSLYEVSCLLVLQLLGYASSTRRRKTWTKWLFEKRDI